MEKQPVRLRVKSQRNYVFSFCQFFVLYTLSLSRSAILFFLFLLCAILLLEYSVSCENISHEIMMGCLYIIKKKKKSTEKEKLYIPMPYFPAGIYTAK